MATTRDAGREPRPRLFDEVPFETAEEFFNARLPTGKRRCILTVAVKPGVGVARRVVGSALHIVVANLQLVVAANLQLARESAGSGLVDRGSGIALQACMRLTYAFCLVVAACNSNPDTAATDASVSIDSAPAIDASTLMPVAFTYTPSWSGVVSVDVIGAFNQSGDWTTPLLSLTASGATFTGTAMLPPGTYPYLFHVVGDADAGASSATYPHLALDGTLTDFVECPAGSPTAGKDPNPCSQLTVPQVAAPSSYHVTGSVQKSGAGVAKWLVVLEREEAGSHHFFVDRMTTTANGNYAFTVAPGQYRVQVQHPQYESKKDSMLDPMTLATVRRNISSSFPVATADVAVTTTEVAFTQYAAFGPKTSATLPTAFTFSSGAPTKLEVYGYATEIGDPWFALAASVTIGTASFDGTFNTSAAGQVAVDNTHTFMWGVETTRVTPPTAVKWIEQSLGFPMTWPTAP